MLLNEKLKYTDKEIVEKGSRVLIKDFVRRKQRSGTSHFQYTHPDLIEILTIPFARPIKSVYVKEALDAIRKLEGSEEE